MEDLSGAALKRATHQQHLAPPIDTGQETSFPKALPECLLADWEPLAPGQVLSHFVTSRRVKV